MRFALSFLAAALTLAASGAAAQTMYKCGNVYQASPCPGGVPVDARNVPKPPAAASTPGTGNAPLDKSAAERASAIKKAQCDPLKANREIVSGILSRGGNADQMAKYTEQRKSLDAQMAKARCNEDDAPKK
ncbi:MAG: hypothetical protein JNM79_00345 [Burkholderiales bacterium]|nr:hypothetical protein [Burkholderiales bacterium]